MTGETPEARELDRAWPRQVAFLGLVGRAEIENQIWFKTWSLTWLRAAPACPELKACDRQPPSGHLGPFCGQLLSSPT